MQWYLQASLPKGLPDQVGEHTYAKLSYTRYVQQTLRDAVLAQLPADGEYTPRTLFWLPPIVTDETVNCPISPFNSRTAHRYLDSLLPLPVYYWAIEKTFANWQHEEKSAHV